MARVLFWIRINAGCSESGALCEEFQMKVVFVCEHFPRLACRKVGEL
jgi:hypothetical protein